MDEILNFAIAHHKARLEITRQTALTQTREVRSNQTKLVNVVVKNSPFHISVCLRDCSPTSLVSLTFAVKLVYDTPTQTEVPFVKTEPLDYKSEMSDGEQLDLSIKIKVLSSHHEEAFFRVKIMVWDDKDSMFPRLETYSEPIKVISKPSKKRKNTSQSSAAKKKPRVAAPKASTVLDAISRVEKQQAEMLCLMRQLLENQIASQSGGIQAITFETAPPKPAPKFDLSARLDFSEIRAMLTQSEQKSREGQVGQTKKSDPQWATVAF